MDHILQKAIPSTTFTQTHNIKIHYVESAGLETAHQEDVVEKKGRSLNYDKEKYREMILDAAETVLGTFGFERTVYGDSKKRREKWWQDLIHEREKDIQTEIT